MLSKVWEFHCFRPEGLVTPSPVHLHEYWMPPFSRWNGETGNFSTARLAGALIWSKVSTSKIITFSKHESSTAKPQSEDLYLSISQYSIVMQWKNQEIPREMLEFPLDSSCTQMPQENMKLWNLRPLPCKGKLQTSTNFLVCKECVWDKTHSKCITWNTLCKHRCFRDLCFCLFLFVSVFWKLFHVVSDEKKDTITKWSLNMPKQNLMMSDSMHDTCFLTFQVPMRSLTVTWPTETCCAEMLTTPCDFWISGRPCS